MRQNKIQYVLILGTQRTGKTLIGRALNMHPDVIVQAEPYFYFFKMCRNIFYRDVLKKKDFDPDSPMDSGFCKGHDEKKLFNKFFSRLFFTKQDIKELIKLTVKQQMAAPSERAIRIIPYLERLRPGRSIAVFKSLMDILYRAYPKKGARIVGLTEGWCDEFIQPFLSLKDIDIKCIHCFRDPRAVVASRNGGSRLHIGKYPVLFMIRHWRKAVAYSILHANKPRYLAVWYENLIEEPERCFRQICNFLGVGFCRSTLKPSTFIKGDGTLWKQNSAFKVASSKGFNRSSLMKWKKILSREEIGVVEYLCEAEFDYLGIKRCAPRFSIEDLLQFKEKEEEIVPWLKKYKLTFNKKEIMLELVRKYIMSNSQLKDAAYLIDYFAIDGNVQKKIAERRNCNV